MDTSFNKNKVKDYIIEKRKQSISDKEIFNELQLMYSNKKELARLIAFMITDKLKQKYNFHNKILVAFSVSLSIVFMIELVIGIINNVKYDILFPIIFFTIYLIIEICYIFKFSWGAYRSLFSILLINIAINLLLFDEWISSIISIYVIINSLLSLIISFYSFYLSKVLFPNFPLEMDRDGNYIFKEF